MNFIFLSQFITFIKSNFNDYGNDYFHFGIIHQIETNRIEPPLNIYHHIFFLPYRISK